MDGTASSTSAMEKSVKCRGRTIVLAYVGTTIDVRQKQKIGQMCWRGLGYLGEVIEYCAERVQHGLRRNRSPHVTAGRQYELL